MIQFRTFVTNNAHRWEHGARDHLACAAALLLAAGADEAPTNAQDLQTLRQQVHGLSTNDAFRRGQLSMQSIVRDTVDEVASSFEPLDRYAFARKLRRALDREFDTLLRSARFAQDAKVLPSETSMEKENSRLRAELAKAQSQLASLVRSNANPPTADNKAPDRPLQHVANSVSELHRAELNNLLVYAVNHLGDRTLAHGVQGGDFTTAFRLTHDLVDRLISRVKNQEQELAAGAHNHRASLAALDKHRVELQVVLNEVRDPREPAFNVDTMTQVVALVGGRLRELRGALAEARTQLRKKAFFAPNDTHARGVRDANDHTARALKLALSMVSDFDVSSIPDYDPSKPGAVTAAVVEAVRIYGRKRYSAGCKDTHKVVDGWLLGLLKSLGCGEAELADVVAETEREGNGDSAFKVACTVILRRVLRLLRKIANDSMPVSLPRPWTTAVPSPEAIEIVAATLVDEIKSRTAEPLVETKLRVLSDRVRSWGRVPIVLSGEVESLLRHLNLWRD